MNLFFESTVSGYNLFINIKKNLNEGNINKIGYDICNFNYYREIQCVEELYYFCRIGDFLIENKFYQEYYNFLLKCSTNKHIIDTHCNDENALDRLKLFEKITLSKINSFEFDIYKFLFVNLTTNLYAKNNAN